LKRIDEIKKALIIATTKNNYEMQWRCLKCYFKELVSVMDEKDDEAQKERFYEVRKNYNIYDNAKRRGIKFIPQQVLDSFDDWEIELKNIEQKYGMNMPKRADPRYALASR